MRYDIHKKQIKKVLDIALHCFYRDRFKFCVNVKN